MRTIERAEVSRLIATNGKRGTTFTGMDLSGIDLSDLKLWGCHFHKCNLRRARFSGANIGNVHFYECDMRDADLSYSIAEGGDSVSFMYCTLNRARFAGVMYEEPDFEGADLSEAMFEDAKLDGAWFLNPGQAERVRFVRCLGDDVRIPESWKSGVLMDRCSWTLNTRRMNDESATPAKAKPSQPAAVASAQHDDSAGDNADAPEAGDDDGAKLLIRRGMSVHVEAEDGDYIGVVRGVGKNGAWIYPPEGDGESVEWGRINRGTAAPDPEEIGKSEDSTREEAEAVVAGDTRLQPVAMPGMLAQVCHDGNWVESRIIHTDDDAAVCKCLERTDHLDEGEVFAAPWNMVHLKFPRPATGGITVSATTDPTRPAAGPGMEIEYQWNGEIFRGVIESIEADGAVVKFDDESDPPRQDTVGDAQWRKRRDDRYVIPAMFLKLLSPVAGVPIVGNREPSDAGRAVAGGIVEAVQRVQGEGAERKPAA